MVYGLWKGALRPSEFHLLGSSQLVHEGEQAAGYLKSLTCACQMHMDQACLAVDPLASFTGHFSLGSEWLIGKTSQPLLVPQRGLQVF